MNFEARGKDYKFTTLQQYKYFVTVLSLLLLNDDLKLYMVWWHEFVHGVVMYTMVKGLSLKKV